MCFSESNSTQPGPEGCPICNHPHWTRVVSKGNYQYVRCQACQTVFVNPIPSQKVLETQYQDPAYFAGDGELGYCNYADTHKALAPHFRRRLRSLGNQITQGQLLDVGCADGYFLEMARTVGWQIAGIELSHEMAQNTSRRLGISIAPSLNDLPDREFDAITLWELLEHLPQPITELGQLRERLRPGGVLMLSTPNANHWQAIREPDSWVSYRPPSHLVLYTSDSLSQALKAAGFERIVVNRFAPLPPLPNWLRRASVPLQRDLSTGQARFWPVALALWRAVRLVGWGWHRLADRHEDIFATLEASAYSSA